MGNGRRSNPYTPQNELDMLSAQVSVSLFSAVDACITLNVPKKKGMWPAVMEILQAYNIEVVNATYTTNSKTDFHCIHCKLEEDSDLEKEDIESIFDDLCMRELGIRPCRV